MTAQTPDVGRHVPTDVAAVQTAPRILRSTYNGFKHNRLGTRSGT